MAGVKLTKRVVEGERGGAGKARSDEKGVGGARSGGTAVLLEGGLRHADSTLENTTMTDERSPRRVTRHCA